MALLRAFLALMLIGAGSAIAGDPAEELPADLREYIEQIKSAGMTEEAASSLMTVAAIETGSTLLLIETDENGKVARQSYSARFCPRPGMSEEALAELRKEQEEMQEKAEREVARLKPLADRDGSGFVSSQEGFRLRQLYILGKQVLEVTSKGFRDGEQVAERLQMSPDKLRLDLASYSELKVFAPLPAISFSGRPSEPPKADKAD